jgi:hypothetical protein
MHISADDRPMVRCLLLYPISLIPLREILKDG